MNFDLREIYKTYANLKEKHDFKEYKDEIEENDKVLMLTGKYRMELNLLAHIYGNNMSVTSQPVSKPPEILWNELRYINQHIPLFALERKGISDYLNQNMGF